MTPVPTPIVNGTRAVCATLRAPTTGRQPRSPAARPWVCAAKAVVGKDAAAIAVVVFYFV